MTLNDIKIVAEPLVLSSNAEVDDAEADLGIRFPSGYREYITRLGEGVLGGNYIRIYPPRRILTGLNNLAEWRQRVNEYWFWAAAAVILTKEKVLECIIVGDTLIGDELIVHPSNPERIYVLPRELESIFVAGDGLLPAMEWLCSSGTLIEPFAERNFEPFDSRDDA